MQITNRFGFGMAVPGLNEFYLKKNPDGRCVFQYKLPGSHWLCEIQHMKPRVCMLWPFMIKTKPKFGREKEAKYAINGKTYYVYINPECNGIIWGSPSNELIQKIMPEFVQLAAGTVKKQLYSTSHSPFVTQGIIQI